MSVSMCISPYLSGPQVYAGDVQTSQRTDLLEALLESCQRSSKNPQLPGFGRELQPYFTEQNVSMMSPQQGLNKMQSTPLKTKSVRKNKGVRSSGNSSEEEGTKKKRGAKTVLKTDKTRNEVARTNSPTIKAVHSSGRPLTSKIAWAGPTFGVAPAPEDIPMPSDFLLAK